MLAEFDLSCLLYQSGLKHRRSLFPFGSGFPLADLLAAQLIEEGLHLSFETLVILSPVFAAVASALDEECLVAVVARVGVDRGIAMKAERLLVVAHDEPGEEFLHVAVAQGEPEIKPDSVLDD